MGRQASICRILPQAAYSLGPLSQFIIRGQFAVLPSEIRQAFYCLFCESVCREVTKKRRVVVCDRNQALCPLLYYGLRLLCIRRAFPE